MVKNIKIKNREKMLEKLEKFIDKFGGTWYKVNQENCKNYRGCGIYSYHIDNNIIVLDNHYSSNMEIGEDDDIDWTESLLRASCWEIQLYNKNEGDWE